MGSESFLDSCWDSHFYPSLTLSTPVGQSFQNGLNEQIILYLKSLIPSFITCFLLQITIVDSQHSQTNILNKILVLNVLDAMKINIKFDTSFNKYI